MKKKLMTLVISLLILLGGCTNISNQIAYTVYPLGYILQRIGGSNYQYVSIQNDEIIQRASLKDNFVEILENSEILLNIGKLEPYLTTHPQSISENVKANLDLSSLNAIYPFKRYIPVINDGDVTFIEAPYYKGDVFNSVDVNSEDLFLWIDPIAMLSMAKDVKEWMVQTYPEDAQIFEDNYNSLENELVRLDAAYQALASKNQAANKEVKFVSMTASFGNWQKTYGIQVYPIILSKYGSLPTLEQLEIIKTRIKNDNVKYIVYEPNMTDDMAVLFEELINELGLVRVELSNLSSLTASQQHNGKDYISIMYENLSVLETMSSDIVKTETSDSADTSVETTAETTEEIEE